MCAFRLTIVLFNRALLQDVKCKNLEHFYVHLAAGAQHLAPSSFPGHEHLPS